MSSSTSIPARIATIPASTFAVILANFESLRPIVMPKEIPVRRNNTAVAGFIATNPGAPRFNRSNPNAQPIRTSVPRQIATPLATRGKARNTIGTFPWARVTFSFSRAMALVVLIGIWGGAKPLSTIRIEIQVFRGRRAKYK